MRRLGAVIESVRPPARAVDELVAHHEVAAVQLAAERAGGARPEYPPDADLLQRPDVGPVVDRVRRKLVVAPVPGEKRDQRAGNLADDDRGRRLSVGRGDLDLFGAFQERIETGAAEDSELSQIG